jgi:hypothetical protein
VIALSALTAAGGAAAGPAISQTAPFTFMGDNLCTGEPIAGTGELHTEINENLSSSGTIQSHMNVRLDGLKAIGTLSGKTYVVQDTENHEFVIAGETSEDTYDMTAHFIRVGEDGLLILGDDFYMSFKTHITANAAGVQSFHVDASDQPCR